MNRKIVARLYSQSTWSLLGLSMITLFVYPAHYVYRQTKIVNEYCDDEMKISSGLTTFIFVFTYLSLILLILSLVADEEPLLKGINGTACMVSYISFIAWGFKARSRMNVILSSGNIQSARFHSLWTFLFTPFYFNFRINQLNRTEEPDHNIRIHLAATEDNFISWYTSSFAEKYKGRKRR